MELGEKRVRIADRQFKIKLFAKKNLKLNCLLSGYHADTPITIKAEAIRKADSHSH